MYANIIKYSLVVTFIGFLSACAAHETMHDKMMSVFQHKTQMRGQIVQVQDDKVVVCIGDEDGADVGMTFNVFDVAYEGSITEGTDNYRLRQVGTIEIESIIDEHFVRGYTMNGKVERNNVVELRDM
jgi:hypothetical protein